MKLHLLTIGMVLIGTLLATSITHACGQKAEELDAIRARVTDKLQVATFNPKTKGEKKTVKMFTLLNSIYGSVLCSSVTAVVAGDETFFPAVNDAANAMAQDQVVTYYKIWKYVFPESRNNEDGWFMLEMGLKSKGTQWILIRYDREQNKFISTQDPEEVRRTRDLMSKLEVLPEVKN